MSLLNAYLDTFINLNHPYTKYTDGHLSLLIRSPLVGPYALTVEPNNYSVISAQENAALKIACFNIHVYHRSMDCKASDKSL